jgi:voltage-gated potassium channel Kch
MLIKNLMSNYIGDVTARLSFFFHAPFAVVTFVLVLAMTMMYFPPNYRERRRGFHPFLFGSTAVLLMALYWLPNMFDGVRPDDRLGVFNNAFAVWLLGFVTVVVVVIRELTNRGRIVLLGFLVAALIIEYAQIYSVRGICADSDCNNIVSDWQSTLYFSVITFTTTGYGDYHPQAVDRLLAASEALSGYIVFGIFVSAVASVFSDRGHTAAQDRTP